MLVVIDWNLWEFIACIMVCLFLFETNSKIKQVPNYSHTYTAEDENKLKKCNTTQLFCNLIIHHRLRANERSNSKHCCTIRKVKLVSFHPARSISLSLEITFLGAPRLTLKTKQQDSILSFSAFLTMTKTLPKLVLALRLLKSWKSMTTPKIPK